MASVGIDLGTSSSTIAFFDGNKPQIIPNVFGETTMPSKIILMQDGKYLVGREAANHVDRFASQHFTIGSIKRKMHEAQGFVSHGKKFYPQVISAMILAKLRQQAEEFLKTTVDEAVICIPCNFGVVQRCVTIEAAEMAGFKVLRIVNEATAAALAFNFLSGGYEESELIFDFGAGTLDLSLIEYGSGVIDVKAIEGIEFLGGDDFDERIIKYIVEETKKSQGFNPIDDQPGEWHHIAKLRLKEAAEKAKIELSSQSSTRIYIPYIRNVLGKAQHIDSELNDAVFESLCSDLIDNVFSSIDKICCQEIVREVSRPVEREVNRVVRVPKERPFREKLKFWKEDEMDEKVVKEKIKDTVKEKIKDKKSLYFKKFVFTGGASKIKCIKDKIASRYRGLTFITREKELVALGAAIYAGIIKGATKNWLVLDCTPKSVGLGLKDNKYQVVIPKNTTIPTVKKDMFTTTKDNQKYVNITVYEGEQEKASFNRKILDLELGPLSPAPAGVPQIEVAFEMGCDNVLRLEATDLGSGKKLQTINSASPYTKLDPNMKNKIKQMLANDFS